MGSLVGYQNLSVEIFPHSFPPPSNFTFTIFFSIQSSVSDGAYHRLFRHTKTRKCLRLYSAQVGRNQRRIFKRTKNGDVEIQNVLYRNSYSFFFLGTQTPTLNSAGNQFNFAVSLVKRTFLLLTLSKETRVLCRSVRFVMSFVYLHSSIRIDTYLSGALRYCVAN